jgi:hypothetical protein
MAEQPLNLVQVPPRPMLPQRALVTEIREQQIDLGQPPTGRRAEFAVDPLTRQDLPGRIAGGEGRTFGALGVSKGDC